MSQMWNRNRIFSELMSYNYRTRLQRFVLKKDIFKAFSKLSFMETFVFQVFPGPSLLLLAAVLDSLCFVVCRRNRRVSSSRQGRGCLVWDQSVVWVGGVRPVVGGWGGGGYFSTWSVIVGSCTRRMEALWWSWWRVFYCNIKPAADSFNILHFLRHSKDFNVVIRLIFNFILQKQIVRHTLQNFYFSLKTCNYLNY